jgi:hypothetical protein
MRPFDKPRYPVSLMIQDALVLLTPVILMFVGILLLE